jgi:dolichol kinase
LFFGFLATTFFVDSLKALAAAAVAMLVESLPLPLSDNLMVPLTAGFVLTFVG